VQAIKRDYDRNNEPGAEARKLWEKLRALGG